MKVLVTGTAGFIGYHLAEHLLNRGDEVIGVDNICDYYDTNLKYARLAESGIRKELVEWNKEVASEKHTCYRFQRMCLEEKAVLFSLCEKEKFDAIVHLAAQAGVRYSLTNPDVYAQANLVSFLNVLEAGRQFKFKHLVYASSSSVYGLNGTMPFSVTDCVDHPVSLYAASKKANELMAHTYSYLYKVPTSGLRFFTVYGPWGRPDMAYFAFTEAILRGKSIPVFNHGKMKRDFTYIDDIVKGIVSVLDKPAEPCPEWDPKQPSPSRSIAPYRIYNIGNNQPVELMEFIEVLENCLGKPAIKEMKEMQPGDVLATWANIDDLVQNFDYKPITDIKTGLRNFAAWYQSYYATPHAAAPKEPMLS